LIISIFILGCSATKRVPDGKYLLDKTEIIVDDKKENFEAYYNILTQKPNARLFNLPLKLYLYNWAKPNSDSLFQVKIMNNPNKYNRWKKLLSAKQVEIYSQSFWNKGIHDFLRNNGTQPIIFEDKKAKISVRKLLNYLDNIGYPKAKVSYKIDTIGSKKIKTIFNITKNEVYTLDTLTHEIASMQIDSMYQKILDNSFLRKNEVYKIENFEKERIRLREYFRNNGVIDFESTFVNFKRDSIGTGNKFNIITRINDITERVQDTIYTRPFEIFRIKEINVFTDSPTNKVSKSLQDLVSYNGINIYSQEKLNFKPKAISNAVFLEKNQLYSDYYKNLTLKAFFNLDQFNTISIQYLKDSIKKELTANIFMEQKKKFQFNNAIDFTHSNIQDIGVNLSISTTLRNVFRGAETLNIALRGNISSSKELSNPDDVFFNVTEYGIETKLNFPRILFPINTTKFIPKTMLPTTTMSLGFFKQQNIGLDKQSFLGTFNYNWTPKKNHSYKFELFNIQYIKNVNPQNYFNVYRRSYDVLNKLASNYTSFLSNNGALDENNNLTIENGTNFFTYSVLEDENFMVDDKTLKSVLEIEERRLRLTENNLIFSSAINYNYTSKNELIDNNFYNFRIKLESAGNFLSLFAKNSNNSIHDNKLIFDIAYSQYFKTELEYIKYFDLKNNMILAFRGFGGIAIPYGNSNSIPFSRSYFAGGSNDIRAWQPYRLGPGSSGSFLNFNEANLKLLFSLEYRYKIYGPLKGAFFIDSGNIWNVLDNVEEESFVFSSLKSLESIAVGTGMGLRYDFKLFVVRLDLGVKTYNPVLEKEQRWFKNVNINESVFNIGINYPF
jgi:Omp85 superfamily domain